MYVDKEAISEGENSRTVQPQDEPGPVLERSSEAACEAEPKFLGLVT